ncbi:hypothetical protein F4779DRAFT_593072 [Xylariaceae sp. FL0662B]|nr:hypothetical protein F4779DRAFT_593072 [Xylariaceae sp. FL0662B]
MSTAASSTAITPSPYVVGQVLNLKGSNGEDLAVTITVTYPLTMSPVMAVQVRKEEGYQEEAILKLFDRRFGDSRKESPYTDDPPKPHTERAEAAFRDYVRRGLVKPLFDNIKRKEDLFDNEGIWEDSESDDDKIEWEKLAEEEGKIQYIMQRYYANEIQAYKELQALQGRCVPRFISSVTLDMPSAQPDLPPTYFQVTGILLQRIHGFNLSELVPTIRNGPSLWEEIVQSAVDAIAEVNRAGVLNLDARPENVVVAKLDDRTFQPFLVDFAHSAFKWQYEDTDDMDNMNGWRSNVHMRDNQGAIGSVMRKKIKRITGYKLKLKHQQV